MLFSAPLFFYLLLATEYKIVAAADDIEKAIIRDNQSHHRIISKIQSAKSQGQRGGVF